MRSIARVHDNVWRKPAKPRVEIALAIERRWLSVVRRDSTAPDISVCFSDRPVVHAMSRSANGGTA